MLYDSNKRKNSNNDDEIGEQSNDAEMLLI